MTFKLIVELNGQRQVLSLDELTKTLLETVRTAVRQEVDRVLSEGTITALPREKNPETIRPVALSKVKAAKALGVSVRTLDYCIAQHKIRVLRIGRRVLVPVSSIEAVSKRSTLETIRGNERQGLHGESSGAEEA